MRCTLKAETVRPDWALDCSASMTTSRRWFMRLAMRSASSFSGTFSCPGASLTTFWSSAVALSKKPSAA